MTRLWWVGVLVFGACAAPQPSPVAVTANEPAEETTASEAAVESGSDDREPTAESDADDRAPTTESDADDREPTAASDADDREPTTESDADDREPTAESDGDPDSADREPAPEPEPEPRRRVCSAPDPPASAGGACPGVRRRWVNIPSRHMRCATDADCVAVAAGHCRRVALNQRAARARRYREPICAGPGEGACGMPSPQPVCEAGCCVTAMPGFGIGNRR